MANFELFKSKKDHQHYWRLVASNGETICSSEGYSSKQMAKKGIRSVRLNSLFAPVVEVDEYLS